ncbi:MerR family transcriptional regulator [Marisediminicola senii]|uniref:MerR family transcriptional regulator n=1 Tax=Marisediminicola senii TaxID=2711233 RepID=UPI0013ED5597|nr:MerR family transcriptional regulator [Marisediminicola senii]
MLSQFMPPRQVKIGDAAAFVGTTPRAIRHYHHIGLLPEPERGSDGRRRYGYDEVMRLLWIRTMADAGIALNDIRDAFADRAPAGADAGADAEADAGADAEADAGADADGDPDVTSVLERLERSLTAQQAELQRQLAAVQRMRDRGSRMGLLSDFVTTRLDHLPEGSLRHADLDKLLVMERIFGPLGAAVNASRYIAMATHPELRQEDDRIDAAEVALDDTVAVDDPRVAQVAAERHAFELALQAVTEQSGLAEADEALFDAWDALHPPADEHDDGRSPGTGTGAGTGTGTGQTSMSAVEAARKMPLDWSPARVRSAELAMELAMEVAADEPAALSPTTPSPATP